MSDDRAKKSAPVIDVETKISEEVAQGVYANVTHVIFSPAEFLLDFGRVVPGDPSVKIHTRVILTPFHAKQLAVNLNEHLRRFEEQFGEIFSPKEKPGRGPVGFKQ